MTSKCEVESRMEGRHPVFTQLGKLYRLLLRAPLMPNENSCLFRAFNSDSLGGLAQALYRCSCYTFVSRSSLSLDVCVIYPTDRGPSSRNHAMGQIVPFAFVSSFERGKVQRQPSLRWGNRIEDRHPIIPQRRLEYRLLVRAPSSVGKPRCEMGERLGSLV